MTLAVLLLVALAVLLLVADTTVLLMGAGNETFAVTAFAVTLSHATCVSAVRTRCRSRPSCTSSIPDMLLLSASSWCSTRRPSSGSQRYI